MSKTNVKKYFYAIGRRKTSTAIIKLFPKGKGEFSLIINGNKLLLSSFFGGNKHLLEDALFAFTILGKDSLEAFDAEITLRGGGIRGQADAMKLGFARALLEYNPELRLTLKPYGLLKRDAREKERKKPGLKKARRAPQWSKR